MLEAITSQKMITTVLFYNTKSAGPLMIGELKWLNRLIYKGEEIEAEERIDSPVPHSLHRHVQMLTSK